jgi:hypothetical protein
VPIKDGDIGITMLDMFELIPNAKALRVSTILVVLSI